MHFQRLKTIRLAILIIATCSLKVCCGLEQPEELAGPRAQRYRMDSSGESMSEVNSLHSKSGSSVRSEDSAQLGIFPATPEEWCIVPAAHQDNLKWGIVPATPPNLGIVGKNNPAEAEVRQAEALAAAQLLEAQLQAEALAAAQRQADEVEANRIREELRLEAFRLEAKRRAETQHLRSVELKREAEMRSLEAKRRAETARIALEASKREEELKRKAELRALEEQKRLAVLALQREEELQRQAAAQLVREEAARREALKKSLENAAPEANKLPVTILSLTPDSPKSTEPGTRSPSTQSLTSFVLSESEGSERSLDTTFTFAPNDYQPVNKNLFGNLRQESYGDLEEDEEDEEDLDGEAIEA